jgi:alkylhydroperoxidase/carboxymuconolactone decarboxylase family protein YurZ
MTSPQEHHATHLDQLRIALSQGMRQSVQPIVKAALEIGCTKAQIMRVAAEVGPYSAREAVQRALDAIGHVPAPGGRAIPAPGDGPSIS